MGLLSWLFGKKAATADASANELLRIVRSASPGHAKLQVSPALKPYVTRLRQVHAKVGSFAAAETPKIGQEIYDAHGHDGMVEVCEMIRSQLGGGPARDLEYKWNGIGEWRG
jgi:hypothetical protein